MSSLFSRLRAALSARPLEPVSRDVAEDERVRRTVARLSAGVAHDLNNILLVLQGYSEMAVEEPDSSPAVRALLDEMRAAAHRASLLVRDLQVLGERGQNATRLIDLSETVRRSLPSLRTACPSGFEIRTMLADGLPPVKADEELVARVVAALCSRARESMPEGGPIVISTAAPAAAGGVRLAVSDSGPPLSAEARAQLFEPYAPGPGGSKGQGLGMSVVRAAARRLGGELRVSSAAGGTTIELEVPRAEAAAAAEEPLAEAVRLPEPPAPSWPRSGSDTILLAEDDEGLRALAVKVLTREGYRVIAARDGQEAVELFAREPQEVRLALLDDVMPRLGGRAALDRIHAISPHLPAILCSGYTWRLDAGLPEAAGRCLVLQKPWQPRDLLRRVREGLEQAR